MEPKRRNESKFIRVGSQKRHSTSPSYQLLKGFRKAVSYHFPTPSSCSGHLGRQRAPSTFPRAFLPTPPPTSFGPLQPSTSTPLHPLHTNTASSNSDSSSPQQPQGSSFLGVPPVCNYPSLPVEQKASNPQLFLSRHGSLTHFLFPALHPQRPTRVTTCPPPPYTHTSFPAPESQNFLLSCKVPQERGTGWREVWAQLAPESRSPFHVRAAAVSQVSRDKLVLDLDKSALISTLGEQVTVCSPAGAPDGDAG